MKQMILMEIIMKVNLTIKVQELIINFFGCFEGYEVKFI